MITRNHISAALVLVTLAGLAPTMPAGRAEPSATATSTAKITNLIKTSDHTIMAKTDTVWYGEWHGAALKDFKVVLAVENDLLVTFVTVATKSQFQETPAFLQALLKFNRTLDFVKVGLDSDGDIFVRCDASVRTLDAESFKAMVDQVAASANEVYEGIGPFLTSK